MMGKKTQRHEAGRIARLTSRLDARNGNRYEAFAPDGYRFINGPHSIICQSEAGALAVAQFSPIEPCPKDCDCGEGGKVQPAAKPKAEPEVKVATF